MFSNIVFSLASQQRRLTGLGAAQHISFDRGGGGGGGVLDGLPQPGGGGACCLGATTGSRRRSSSGSNGRGSTSSARPCADRQQPSNRRSSFEAAASGRSRCSDAAGALLRRAHSASGAAQPLLQVPCTRDGDASAAGASSYAPRSHRRSCSKPAAERASSSSGGSGDDDTAAVADTNTSDADGDDSSWQQDDAVAAAIGRISRFLDFRERCASEVLAKLAELGYEQELTAAVLARLQAAGVQDDARFAEMFAHSAWTSRAHAPARITYELRARRVSQAHIDAALAAVFGATRQLPGRMASSNGQDVAWQQLVEACRRRAELSVGEPQQKRRAKLATWLQRRGHPLSAAFRMFDELGI